MKRGSQPTISAARKVYDIKELRRIILSNLDPAELISFMLGEKSGMELVAEELYRHVTYVQARKWMGLETVSCFLMAEVATYPDIGTASTSGISRRRSSYRYHLCQVCGSSQIVG